MELEKQKAIEEIDQGTNEQVALGAPMRVYMPRTCDEAFD
jgi:hypothetical protein